MGYDLQELPHTTNPMMKSIMISLHSASADATAPARAATAASRSMPRLATAIMQVWRARPPKSIFGRLLRAAGPWSPANHALFPAAARARAVESMSLGSMLSRDPRYGEEMRDIWHAYTVASVRRD